jgi:CRISPR-associated protein Cas2
VRLLYIVTYDISEDKRLRTVFRLMTGYGDHVQYSVFRCELSDLEKMELIRKLSDILKYDEDQVLFFPMGPAGGDRERGILALGRAYVPIQHGPVVI